MRALIDTCVLLDVLQAREPFLKDSKRVLLASANGVIEGLTTAKAITDIFYLMHRHLHDNDACNKVVQNLYSILEVVDTRADVCLRASFSAMSDYEDAVMDETAKAESADLIITRNLRDYRKADTKVASPANVVKDLKLDELGL